MPKEKDSSQITLDSKRSEVLKHVLNIAGEVFNVDKEDWFKNAVETSHKEDWSITKNLNEGWASTDRTPEDEDKLYSTVEYALDCCKCYTHYTKGSVKATVQGVLDIRKKIPGFADGWTFVDYFAGIGLSSIYLAQQLTAAGIDAKVVCHNISSNKTQVELSKRLIKEFGSPDNLSMHFTKDMPFGNCFLFYEVFEHIKEPWAFMKDLIEKRCPMCVVHVSRFNLPNINGHHKVYKIDGAEVSGKIATREFEKKFKTAGYVRTIIPQEFNGIPRVEVLKDVIPLDIAVSLKGKWDLKTLSKREAK